MSVIDAEIAKLEWLKCSKSPAYWLDNFAYLYNATDRTWMPFKMWAAQHQVIDTLHENTWIVVLKARQLGLSWLVLGYILWMMLFRPGTTALVFSRREDEAVDLINFRLKGIYLRLPRWMRAKAVIVDSKLDWRLSNGSNAKGFPTTGARSYTGTIVVIDEADYIDDLDGLMNAVKPTIDAGGQLIILSTSDKSKPNSPFKRIYRGAKQQDNGEPSDTGWVRIFLPWYARPDRNEEWYKRQATEIEARTTVLDDLYQEYPATDIEALAPRSLDKRIPFKWIEKCYKPLTPITDPSAPSLPGLHIYRVPEREVMYVIGGDPAEGNPTSDDSAMTVMNVLTGEEVASLAGKLEPSTFADYVNQVGIYYNYASAMIERNNHGHAVIQWMGLNSKLRLLPGHDQKPGWLSNKLGKVLMYNQGADMFRDETTILHSEDTYVQLVGIEGSTLLAPKGDRDDLADSYVVANAGRAAAMVGTTAMRQAPIRGRKMRPAIRTGRRRRAMA